MGLEMKHLREGGRSGGVTKNQYIQEKGGLGQFADLRGTWQERG